MKYHQKKMIVVDVTLCKAAALLVDQYWRVQLMRRKSESALFARSVYRPLLEAIFQRPQIFEAAMWWFFSFKKPILTYFTRSNRQPHYKTNTFLRLLS